MPGTKMQPAAKPAAQPAAQPVAQLAAQPAAQLAGQPAAKAAVRLRLRERPWRPFHGERLFLAERSCVAKRGSVQGPFNVDSDWTQTNQSISVEGKTFWPESEKKETFRYCS